MKEEQPRKRPAGRVATGKAGGWRGPGHTGARRTDQLGVLDCLWGFRVELNWDSQSFVIRVGDVSLWVCQCGQGGLLSSAVARSGS